MQEKPQEKSQEVLQSTSAAAQQWFDICHVDEVFEECGRRYELKGLPPLAVFNLGESFQVTDDTCTHGDASLADGWVKGTEVECPFHSGKFCLKTGKATAYPADQPLKMYPTRVEAGKVQFCIVPMTPEE